MTKHLYSLANRSLSLSPGVNIPLYFWQIILLLRTNVRFGMKKTNFQVKIKGWKNNIKSVGLWVQTLISYNYVICPECFQKPGSTTYWGLVNFVLCFNYILFHYFPSPSLQFYFPWPLCVKILGFQLHCCTRVSSHVTKPNANGNFVLG